MAKAQSTAPAKAPEPVPAPKPAESAPAKPAEPQTSPESDYKVALKQERVKTRKLREDYDRAQLELAEARGALEQTEKFNRQEMQPPQAPSGFTEEDMADPAAFNRRLEARMDARLAELERRQDEKVAQLQQESAADAAAQRHREAIEREFGRYDLTADPHSEMGRLARASFDRAIYDENALGREPTMEAAKELIEQTVKDLSKFVVKEAEPAKQTDEPPQPAPASGGGEVNHLKTDDGKPKTVESVVSAAFDSFEAKTQQEAGKGG